jgi:hypothetical protein
MGKVKRKKTGNMLQRGDKMSQYGKRAGVKQMGKMS